ncbi:2-keto-4-pentenoate hydratase [Cryptosporangium minutisporangium]|uniref:2-keto-4-pentenoate hydratase n=1 Tax=Cryptosporangium minutisporangium TaxID=113569 RepID=A0ABP6SUA2_9ACTN
MLDLSTLAAAADALRAAERDRTPIPPLITTYPGIDVGDAYRIQLRNIERRLSGGGRVVGHKVGLSSKAMQQMMGVDEPDYGHLLADMAHTEDVPVDTGRYLLPRVEPEVGFILGDDLPEDCTEEQALAATEAIAPALELIDSRIVDWKIALPDTIADNASSAGFVLGSTRLDPRSVDLTALPVRMFRNDEEVGVGASSAVLGNPLVAVAWLARTVARFGVRLEAGHVVLPGSCTRAVDARPGDVFRAEFGVLGAVQLAFQPAADESQLRNVGQIPTQRGGV